MPLIRLLLRLYNLYLSPERDFARRVRDLVGFAPARLSIFRLAFAHKSNQRVDRATGQSSANNNERLEYLGDAVLGTIVAEYLFKKYPDTDEGFLTKMRSRIVKRKSLNAIGDEMGLDVFLTELNRVRLSSSMLGNAVEALCGAVYLERGYEGTKRFVIRRMLRPYVDIHALETTDDNYKSQLLEHCQKNGKAVAYQLVEKFKRDRRDRFRVGVLVDGERVAEADDFNKKAAEQLASRRALEFLGAIDAAAPAAADRPAPGPSRETKKKAGKSRRRVESAPVAAEPQPVAEPDPGTTAPTPEPAAAPPKPRRRSTGLTRTVYHATRTASAALAALEHSGGAAASVSATAAPEPAPEPTAASAPTPPTRPRRDRAFSRTLAEATRTAAAGLLASETAGRPVAHRADAPAHTPAPGTSVGAPVDGEPARRRRRSVPLRLLTPMINHAAAALAIEFAGAPASSATRREGGRPTPPPGGALATERVVADERWDDTPLELVIEPDDDDDGGTLRAPRGAGSRDEGAPPGRSRRRRRRDRYDWVVSRDWVDLAPPPNGRPGERPGASREDDWGDTPLELAPADGEA